MPSTRVNVVGTAAVALLFSFGCDDVPSLADGGEFADGATPDGGLPTDAEAPADAGGDAHVGPVDAGDIEVALERTTASLDRMQQYSGREVVLTVELFTSAGDPADLAPELVTAFVTSGTSTIDALAASRVGAGRYEIVLVAGVEGTPIEIGVRVNATDTSAVAGPLTVVQPLLHYVESGAAVELASLTNNLSGVTYNPVTDSYWMIRNNDRFIHEVSPTLEVLSSSHLNGAPLGYDLEDITYLGTVGGEHQYAVVNEYGDAAIGTIPAAAPAEFGMSDWQLVRYAPSPSVSNKGGEGIAYDPDTDTFWVCTERSPMTIHRFRRPPAGGDVDFETGFVVDEPFDADAALSGTVTDVSSCIFDSRTRRLLILSHESARIVDLALDGTVMGVRDVSGAPQFEGIALIGNDLALVSEPDFFRRYAYDGPVVAE